MKNSSKYIAVSVIISLSVVFAYQAWWLVRMYRTASREMDARVVETMRISDWQEIKLRLKKYGGDPDINGEISVSAGYTDEMAIVKSVTTRQEDTVKMVSVTQQVVRGKAKDADTVSAGAALQKPAREADGNHDLPDSPELLLSMLFKGMHSGVDVIEEADFNVYDSLLTANLSAVGLDVPHRLELLRRDGDRNETVECSGGTDGYAPGTKAVSYEYAYEISENLYYRLWMEPVGGVVLRQMTGVLATSLVIFIILVFSFWFLVHTIRRQKSLDEMKTDFTNNITHELKTPIAVAYAANDALLNFGRSEKPVEREKYLKICQEQLRMLGGMVEQILSMSMERRRNLVLDKEEICLKPLVEAVAERQRIKADKEVSIKCVVDPESLTVMADRVHFHNVMSNLVDNAVKYSHGRADVEIFCHASGAGGAVIEVKDHGIGMSVEQQKRIFDRFYRVPAGDVHEVKGYGLGLFYVRNIVEKHGWKIYVSSTPGKGSVFTIVM